MQKKRLIRHLVGIFTSAFGLVVALHGLTRLGWRRHETSALDLGFLHLDWMSQTNLPYWSAHVSNLSIFLVGSILVVAGLWVCLWSLLRRRETEPHKCMQPTSPTL